MIPTIITQALTQQVIHLGNLDARRDMTYVQDTVAAFIKVALVSGVEGDTYNLGSGSEISIGDLAALIVELTGKSCDLAVDPNRLRPEKSEVQRLIADNSLARKHLGWEPQVRLRDGLAQTIDWIEAHLDLYRPDQYQI